MKANMISIDRSKKTSALRKILKEVKYKVSEGKSIIIFPEGTRSKDQRIKRGYNGATLLAIDTESIILPMGIYGTERITNYFQFLFPNKKVTVNIGEPFRVANLPQKKNKKSKRIYGNLCSIS